MTRLLTIFSMWLLLAGARNLETCNTPEECGGSVEKLAGDTMLGKHITPADSVDVHEEDCASDAMLAKQAKMLVAQEKLDEEREDESMGSTDEGVCRWSAHSNKYSSGYAQGADRIFMDLSDIKTLCTSLGAHKCKAVTCKSSGTCRTGASETLKDSPSGETTHVPNPACFMAASKEPSLDRYFTASESCDYPFGVTRNTTRPTHAITCPGHYTNRRRQCMCPCFKRTYATDGDGTHRRRCGTAGNGGGCASGTFNDGTTDDCQSCSGTINTYQTSCYVADDATEEEDLDTAGGEWVKGANGETCDNVCEDRNQICDEAELSKLTTDGRLGAAFKEAGYTCKSFVGSRSYAGTPFSTGRSDDCFGLVPGSPAKCGGNRYSGHSRLCYCKAPEPTPQPAPQYLLQTIAAGGTYAGLSTKTESDVAYCRCHTEDYSEGISVCNTGCGDPDTICTPDFGCSFIEQDCNAAKCTCKPFGISTNDMTYQQCHDQCSRVGMVVLTGEAGINATRGTGCNINNKETWVAREAQPTPPTWTLALNLNPSDGHRMGYGSSAWSGGSDVGTPAVALAEDYVSKTAYGQISNYIAIARHPVGSDKCEAVKVWKWAEAGKTLRYHMNTVAVTGDVPPKTTGGAIYENNPTNLADQDKDPIFGNTGDLQVNYYYSNNGCRMFLTDAYGYPTTANTDDIHGFGNEFGADTSNFQGSDKWWHDVAERMTTNCHGDTCAVMGTDHGPGDPGKLGSVGSTNYQYAIYTSQDATVFPCEGEKLSLEEAAVPTPTLEDSAPKTGPCLWASPHNMPSRKKPLCEDGAFTWDCVGEGHGHRLQCSSSHPVMCNSMTCGSSGKNYCCEAKESDCDNLGGVRPKDGCPLPVPPCDGCCAPRVPLDLIFLLDSSGSIGEKGFDQSRMFLKRVAQHLPLGQGNVSSQVAIVQFSDAGKESVEVPLADGMTYEKVEAAVNAMKWHTHISNDPMTHTGEAIEYLLDNVFPANSTGGVAHMLVLITDGQSNGEKDPGEVSAKARQRGIDIVAVGVAEYNYDELMDVTGDASKILTVKNHHDLVSIVNATAEVVCKTAHV